MQLLLVYVTLALAVGYLLKKFFLPKRLFAAKKKTTKDCGEGDCGCH